MKKKILFLTNKQKDCNLKITNEIIEYLVNKSCEVYVEDDLVKLLSSTLQYDENILVDFCFVLGGDGTILNYAHKYKDSNFTFLGINLGRVGCLTQAEVSNYKDIIDSILNNEYYVEERTTILCSIYKNEKLFDEVVSFNEVCLQKGKLYKMLLINMLVNDKNSTSFYGDGVIVSTATGSSAYNLSSGGPLLVPTAKNFVITPVCPQLRSITSLVVNDSDKIELKIREDVNRESYEKEKPVVVVDGWCAYEIGSRDKVVIQKNDKLLKIIKNKNDDESLFKSIFKVAMSNRGMFINDEEND